jgi:acetyl-CoA carboxylase beta subunit
MSIKKIVEKAVANDPLGLKEAFEEEMQTRVAASIEEKYNKMAKNEEEEEGKECPHCEGVGYHIDEDDNKVECPHCEGTGRIKEGEHDDEDDDDDDDDEEEKEESKKK